MKEIWNDLKVIFGEAFKTIFSTVLLTARRYIMFIFHIFWMEDETAIGILRTGNTTKHQILSGTFVWLVFILINSSALINKDTRLWLPSLFLTIVSLALFLYWIKLGITYSLKRHIVNPDREV